MSALAYRKAYSLPRGYTVEFSLDGGLLGCAWSPGVPTAREFKRLLPAYRKARNKFIASLGLRVAVVEI